MQQAQDQQHPDYLKQILTALEQGAADEIREILSDLHPADIGNLLEAIPPEQRHIVWELVHPELMGEVLVEVPEGVRTDLVEKADEQALVAATSALDTDDIADLIPDLPDDVIAQVMFTLDTQERQRLDTVLSYPEDTAGGLMNVDAVTVREEIALDVVLRYLRRRGEIPEHTNELYVVNRDGLLVGSLLVVKLLITDTAQRVRDVMQAEPRKFHAMTPAREVAAAFERYNLVTAPVTDENDYLLGRITVDDVVDVIRDEADHSVMAPAGLSEEEDLFAPVARSARNRAVWLGVNLITAILASWVISFFEPIIKQVVALAVLMPIVASMGGNAGTQTVTLVVRGLALGTITDSNARRILVKELLVSVSNGMIWALVVAIVAVVWYENQLLALVIGLAMVINLVVAALAGVFIPITVRKLGIDPALASGVGLTTVTDVVGFFVFLGLATMLLI